MKQHVIWLVLLVGLCGYYMSNQEELGRQQPVHLPRGPALTIGGEKLGDPPRAPKTREELASPDVFRWRKLPEGRFSVDPKGRIWALEGTSLQQGERTLIKINDTRQRVEQALGSWVERPYWASRNSAFYLQERVQVEYQADLVVWIRLYNAEALRYARQGGTGHERASAE